MRAALAAARLAILIVAALIIARVWRGHEHAGTRIALIVLTVVLAACAWGVLWFVRRARS